jgi:hypothetical protein
LKLAVTEMNGTQGPEGLVPSLFVFGARPRFPGSNTILPNQKDRMDALIAARAKMETITAELKIRKALTSQVPPAAQYQLPVGQRVLIDREVSILADGPLKSLTSRRSKFSA